jgi:hypothetical protein
MRRSNFIKCVLLGIIFIGSGAFAENWVLIKYDEKAIAYVDKDSIKKTGSFISASQKIELPLIKAEVINFTIYNCKERESSIQKMMIKRPDGSFDELKRPESSWAYIPKGTDGNALTLEYVCTR